MSVPCSMPFAPSSAARGESPAWHRGRRCARLARRDEREYREYLNEEQRSQPGCSAGRMQLEFHHGLLEMISRPGLATLCGYCIVWTLACGRAAPASRPTHARNLVLITIDTLRADHVGAYGYRQARTPALDGLARGVLFEHAFA